MEWGIEELLDRLQARDECQKIEAKEARNALGKSALETISAFSNEPDLGGGYLVLGLRKRENGSPGRFYDILGVVDPDSIQQEIANVCRGSFNRRIVPEISVHCVGGQSLVYAFIPEAFCRDKPIYINSKGEKEGTFRRIGSGDARCTEEDFDELYQLRRQRKYESEVLPSVTWEDVSQEAIKEYRRLRAEVEPGASELSLGDPELLISLKTAVRKNGQVIPTVAGLLLFGSKEALRRELPMAARVDYIVMEGTKWIGDPSARYEYEVTYRESLITLMPRLHSQIMSDIPSKFALAPSALERKDIPVIPREVIREALANALMHRDYRSHAPTQIIRYTNRIEFRNAGYSLKSMEELGEPGSKPRNPIIAAVFHDLKRVETKGTGIGAIVEKMRATGLSIPPIFESDRDKNEFDLILLPHHLLDQVTLEWLSQFKEIELSDEQRRALAFTRAVGAITNQDFRQLNGTDTLVASKALCSLRDVELLEQKGKGNRTYYQLGPLARGETHLLSSLSTPGISIGDKGGTPGISSGDKGTSSMELRGLDALPTNFPELPGELKQEIRGLGARSRDPQLVKKIIRELCALASLSKPQLAAILGRTEDHLRKSYLSKMIQNREIEYVFEDPAHPNQAYRTPEGKGR